MRPPAGHCGLDDSWRSTGGRVPQAETYRQAGRRADRRSARPRCPYRRDARPRPLPLGHHSCPPRSHRHCPPPGRRQIAPIRTATDTRNRRLPRRPVTGWASYLPITAVRQRVSGDPPPSPFGDASASSDKRPSPPTCRTNATSHHLIGLSSAPLPLLLRSEAVRQLVVVAGLPGAGERAVPVDRAQRRAAPGWRIRRFRGTAPRRLGRLQTSVSVGVRRRRGCVPIGVGGLFLSLIHI